MTMKRRASEPEAVTYRQSLANQEESLFFLHEANHSAYLQKIHRGSDCGESDSSGRPRVGERGPRVELGLIAAGQSVHPCIIAPPSLNRQFFRAFR
jgi:hypothetical protein